LQLEGGPGRPRTPLPASYAPALAGDDSIVD